MADMIEDHENNQGIYTFHVLSERGKPALCFDTAKPASNRRRLPNVST